MSIISCSLVAFQVTMSDFGAQTHIFTPIQKYVNTKIDNFYGVSHDELHGAERILPQRADKPFISLQRVDVKKS